MVTRTPMLDMAASVARVKMEPGILKGSPILVRDCDSKRDIPLTSETSAKMLCAFSAGGRHLAVLKWARARECPWC